MVCVHCEHTQVGRWKFMDVTVLHIQKPSTALTKLTFICFRIREALLHKLCHINTWRTGDRVTYDGKTWESTIDNNVWQPGVYGWIVYTGQPQ